MGVNKVNFGNDNLIDLTSDTVTEQTLLRGTTAHNRAGEPIEGVLDVETNGITWNEAEGYVGYNLCPFNPYVGTNNGITSTIVDDHKIKVNGTTTTTFGLGISEPTSSYQTIGTHLLRAGSYKLLVEASTALSSSCFVAVYSDNVELASVNSGTSGSDTFTLEEDTTLMVAIGFASSTIVSDLVIQAMIVKDTVSSDVPYQRSLIRNDEIIDAIYPINSVYISMVNVNPSTYWPGTTWQLLSDGYLRNNAPNATGGSLTSGSTTLTIQQIPSHNHTATTNIIGNHSHTATTGSYGAHTHNEYIGHNGTYNAHLMVSKNGSTSRADGAGVKSEYLEWITQGYICTTNSAGAHTHTLTTNTVGNHSHTLTTESKGGGQGHTHSVEPTYTRIYAFKRTA